MTEILELSTTFSKTLTVELPEPGSFESFFIVCMGYSGNFSFLKLLEHLMAAAQWPLLRLDELLPRNGVNFNDLTVAARQSVFRLQGYGLGNFFDLDPIHRDEVGRGKKTVLFLRDPREMIAQMYRQGAWKHPFGSQCARDLADLPRPSFADFIKSPRVAHVLQRYRQFAEFRRGNPYVGTFRYEQALAGWNTIAADLVAWLDLPLDHMLAMGIAQETPPISNRLPHQSMPTIGTQPYRDPDLSDEDWNTLEREAADGGIRFGFGSLPPVLPRALGVGSTASVPTVATLPSGAAAQRSPFPGSAATEKPAPHNNPGPIFENDPQTWTRLRPNSSRVVHVLGRDVVMEVNASGCRPVTGQPETGETTLALYGCSCTYGIAVATEETFSSRLQGMLPKWRIENHGIPAHGTSHNLLLLERLTRWSKPELVAFCWIGHHRIRNVVDIKWVQSINNFYPKSPAGTDNRRPMPRAALDARGFLALRSTLLPRHDLTDLDLTDFYTDQFYQDLVSFRLFQKAAAHVHAYGGKFFVVSLIAGFSEAMRGWFAAEQIPVLDASLNGPEWTCLPDDGHPNARAHQTYAERIFAYLTDGHFRNHGSSSRSDSDTPPLRPIGPRA